ncbi:MAG: M3 family metallopeptidase [Xanthomonadales bacterium]|nr:M3 family metallopeptidase [Xanthomonadales bacterium]
MRNPLRHSTQAFRLPDFAAIKPEHVMPALEELLAEYEEGIEKQLAATVSPGWSIAEAEAGWGDEISRAWSPVSHLNSVADNEAMRQAYNAGLKRLTEHENWRQQNPELFRAYRELRDSPSFRELSPVQQRIVELELREFRLAGVGLSGEDQARYRELVLRMSELGSKFSENLLDATRAWSLHLQDRKRLSGLPEAELRLLQGLAQARGKSGWLIDLSAPSFQAIMTHAEDRELRRDVYTAYVTRASDRGPFAGEWDNSPLIRELLSLRHELACLLGFGNYVELALSRRMADSPETVLVFLETLAEKAVPAAQRQYAELLDFARDKGAEQPLQAWDVAYWSERYRQSELHLSDEELKPYFPLAQMLRALFHTSNRLFGIELAIDESVATWHPDVRFYWLQDADGYRFGGLFMDLFARQDKRGGAWMDVCLSKRKLARGLQLPVAYLNCNFAPAVDGHPCLMTHNDVQTLFHEFGHCLHHLLTEVEWPQVNGINNVEWDAVELPSQLLENWCWEDEVLGRFARHYESGEALPDDLRKRLLRSRHFQQAMVLVRQLEYALCDLRLHLEYDPENPGDPLALLQEIRQQVCVVPVPQFSRFLNGFSHIFGGGYSAGYYSYLWAEQLAADAWDRFRAEGALAPTTGKALRDEILAVGASRPAIESFVAFRGRPPEPGPLLESYGLL